jgi:hypothetical protein
VSTSDRKHAGRRLVAAAAFALCVGLGVVTASTYGSSYSFPPAVPKAKCGPGARPETSIQGRVPGSDYKSNRVLRGYMCNTRQLSHHGTTGGFKVQRYTDVHGNTCAYYDSTALIGKDVLAQLAGPGLGVIVLDMNDPAHPRQTAHLTSPAMLSPHESVLLNQRRGLLAAVLATPATALGIVDIYDVRTDCRHPRKLSSTPTGVLGHESGFAPDGKTFWTASSSLSLVAIDVSNPSRPRRIFQQFGVVYHGLRLSNDGRTMYVANIGTPSSTRFSTGGLRILDVSQVQDRKPNPEVTVLSNLTWREESIPQVNEPFTRNGHHYLLEVDEYANFNPTDLSLNQLKAPVGAARIINVDDPRHPFVVSDLRLQVHQPANRAGDQQNDPGAIVPVQGYTAHYCSVPYRDNPKLVACSMNLSGLRVFDIRDLAHPKEAAYFNRPIQPLANPLNPLAIGGYGMSQNAWDVKGRSLWYTDVNSGFYVVKLTNGVGRLLDR